MKEGNVLAAKNLFARTAVNGPPLLVASNGSYLPNNNGFVWDVLTVTSKYRIRVSEKEWLGGRPGMVVIVKNKNLAKLFPSLDIAERYQRIHGGEIVSL
jgi:hypothetical protein